MCTCCASTKGRRCDGPSTPETSLSTACAAVVGGAELPGSSTPSIPNRQPTYGIVFEPTGDSTLCVPSVA